MTNRRFGRPLRALVVAAAVGSMAGCAARPRRSGALAGPSGPTRNAATASSSGRRWYVGGSFRRALLRGAPPLLATGPVLPDGRRLRPMRPQQNDLVPAGHGHYFMARYEYSSGVRLYIQYQTGFRFRKGPRGNLEDYGIRMCLRYTYTYVPYAKVRRQTKTGRTVVKYIPGKPRHGVGWLPWRRWRVIKTARHAKRPGGYRYNQWVQNRAHNLRVPSLMTHYPKSLLKGAAP